MHLNIGYPEQITSSRQAAEDFSWIHSRLLTAPLQALRGHDNNPFNNNNLSYHIGNSTLLKAPTIYKCHVNLLIAEFTVCVNDSAFYIFTYKTTGLYYID